MVQSDSAVFQVLPDAEADISAGGWEKSTFKFRSIRVPGLEGFEEREGCGRIRAARGEIIVGGCGVEHVPQAHDGGSFLRLSVRVRADERNRGSGWSFVRNGTTTSLGAGRREQQPDCHKRYKTDERPVAKQFQGDAFCPIHDSSPLGRANMYMLSHSRGGAKQSSRQSGGNGGRAQCPAAHLGLILLSPDKPLITRRFVADSWWVNLNFDLWCHEPENSN